LILNFKISASPSPKKSSPSLGISHSELQRIFEKGEEIAKAEKK
jgi:hypothetical protein